jgi:hypothetical protein
VEIERQQREAEAAAGASAQAFQSAAAADEHMRARQRVIFLGRLSLLAHAFRVYCCSES